MGNILSGNPSPIRNIEIQMRGLAAAYITNLYIVNSNDSKRFQAVNRITDNISFELNFLLSLKSRQMYNLHAYFVHNTDGVYTTDQNANILSCCDTALKHITNFC